MARARRTYYRSAHDEMSALRGRHLRVNAKHVQSAIRAVLDRRSSLESRRRGAWFMTAFFSVLAVVRALALWRPGTAVDLISLVALGMLLTGAIGGAVEVRRITGVLENLQ